ncbi:MAG: acyltransferase [Chromatiales bacterium]|nr:acyltransferase [Chromatiales bacterium]
MPRKRPSEQRADTLLGDLRLLASELSARMRREWNRRLPLGDLINDRWQIASDYGFGEGTSCYDSVVVIGDVKVGRDCWIGPNVILDGSGGLVLGDWCCISAGAQIYSHDTIERYTSLGAKPARKAPTRLGDGVYVGPQAVISMGVTIGSRAVIGANSLVRSDIPDGSRAWGTPARVQPATPT